MKRNSKLFIGLIAAAITFGSLWAFTGRQNSGWNRYHHNRYHHCEMKNDAVKDSLQKNQ